MSTNVALSTHFEVFIRQQIDSGRYDNASEVIKAGLRLLEDQESRQSVQLQDLRLAISAGTTSGPDKPSDEVFDRLEEKYRALADRKA